MTEQQVLNSVENFEKEFQAAVRKFEQRGQSLSTRSSYTQLQLSDMGKARELIREGVEITRDYYTSCEAIIFALDSLARPLLDQGLSARAVGAVAALMEAITKDMDGSSTTFSVSLNGVALGNAGEVMPKPDIQAKSIQLFWKQQYRTMPGYAQEEARKKAEADEKKRKEQEAAAAARNAAEAAQAEIEKRKQAAKAVEQRRQQLQARCDQALEDYRTKASDAIYDLRSSLADQNSKRADAVTARCSELKKQKRAAKGEERKQLAEQIADLEAEAVILLSDAYRQEQVDCCRAIADRYVEQYEQALQQHLDRCYQEKEISESVAVPVAVSAPSSGSVDSQQDEILCILRYSEWLTVSEIVEQMGSMLTNQRVAALLRQLVTSGQVVRMEDARRAYFALPGTPFRQTRTVWEENTELVQQPLPTPPQLVFQEKDYEARGRKEIMIQDYRDAVRKKKQSRTGWAILAAIAVLVVAALIIGSHISAKNEQARVEQIIQLAEAEANRILSESIHADWAKDNGVSQMTATVQEVIFVPKSYLLYDYQKPHYLVKLRIDCTAHAVEFDRPDFLAYDIADAMPASLGVVDDYRIYLRAESIKNSDELYGGEPYEYNMMTMVYIYVNGSFVQGPKL